MRPFFFLIFLVPLAAALAGQQEDQARAVLDQLNAAGKIKDVQAISRLIASECFIIMTEPAAGAKRARFFTRESYLKLLTERYSKTAGTESTRTIQTISVSESGDVFLACDVDERTRAGDRSEWIRSREYIVMKQIGKRMLIRAVVGELAFYTPDVPREPIK